MGGLPYWQAWTLLGLLGAVALAIALLAPAISALALAALLVLVAVLVRPWWGLPLLAVAIPFAAVQPLPFAGGLLDGADLLLVLVVTAWALPGLASGQFRLAPLPLTLPLLALIGALLVSLLGAASYREGIPELVKWLQVLVLYWCVAAILPTRYAGWMLAGLLVAGAGQALLGAYQFVTQTGPEGFVLLGRFMRAYGTFRQPNPYAGYLGMVAPLALSLALWSWATRQAWWLRLVLLAITVTTTLGLLMSWSRGAWIAFAAASAVVILAQSRRAAPLVVVVAVAVLALGAWAGLADLLPSAIVDRLSDLQSYVGLVDIQRLEVNDANFSVIERIAHWQAASGIWADHPWFGVGAGNYAVAYEQYALPRWGDPLGHAHNVYLNFGAEAGLIGFLAYLVLWAAAIWQAVRAAAAGDRLVAAVGAGVLGVLTHATVHNLFDNLWVQHIYLHLALLLGLLAVFQSPRASAANAS